MNTFIKNNAVTELDNSDIERINGGGPIFEAIAWLYGYAHARAVMHADMEITKEHRVLLGG
jgi:hypothetical protein